MWSSGRSEALLEAELPVPIEIRPIRGAKRLRLRFDETSGTLKLTCPMRTSRRAALAWALDQSQWIEAQLARALPPEPFEAGAVIPVEGVDILIVWSEREPRIPRLMNSELRCGGPAEGLARSLEVFLKRKAFSTM
jgi:predicted metal-dependent hydrolase